jgi:hypothetical protein
VVNDLCMMTMSTGSIVDGAVMRHLLKELKIS